VTDLLRFISIAEQLFEPQAGFLRGGPQSIDPSVPTRATV
jgi:hypothetical protein